MKYEETLNELAGKLPATAACLSATQENRRARLAQYLGGARLKGFEQLITHIDELKEVFTRNRKLSGLAFLLDRALGDFQVALEAGLGGLNSVAHDAMRDVMEIEFLFREFEHDPNLIQDWLTCTNKERHDRFRPAVLRQRHALRLGKQPQDLSEALDYKAHSESLHVSPNESPLGGPGISEVRLPFGEESYFWEIFEHGRRFLFAAHRLRRRVARHLKAPPGPWRGLKDFRDAWQRTREMQAMAIAIIQVALEEDDNGAA